MEWKGKLILPIGPSGSGKSTLIAHVKNIFPQFVYPVTSTTRAMRPGEIPDVSYHFLSRGEFEKRIDKGLFLEWAEYGGNLYGTPKEEILQAIAEGKTVLREVEVQGVRSIQHIVPQKNLIIIYIDAGPWEMLEERILKRTPLSLAEVKKRRKRYEDERNFKDKADYVISNYNGKLEDAKKSIGEIISKIINKT